MAVQHGGLDRTQAIEHLRDARALGIRFVPCDRLWEAALNRAIDLNHPAYDTLFVELAVEQAAPLATFDRKLLELFPGIAKRPGELGQP